MSGEKVILSMFTSLIGTIGSLFFGITALWTFFIGPVHGFGWEVYFFIFLACIANLLFSWVIFNSMSNNREGSKL